MSKATCAIVDCGKPLYCRGWCSGHYQRWNKHGDPLGGKKSPAVLKAIDHEDGTRTCAHCHQRQPLEQYDLDKLATLGRRAKCKTCRCEQMKQWYAENQERQLERARKRFQRDIDKIRANDMARYRRDRDKRIALVTDSVHRRRASLYAAKRDKGISHISLRKRDGDLCCYCGITMDFKRGTGREFNPERATIEHVVALASGGTHTWENVALCCWQCNVRKNKTPLLEWLSRG